MKSVLILEDAAEVRAWLVGLVGKAFPGTTVVESGSLAQALHAIESQQFDLALIDINLPDGNGTALLRELRRRAPDTYCVIATIFDDDDNIIRALQDGAQGYLLKDQSDERLIEGLRGILNGEPPLSPTVARRILGHFRQPPATVATNLTDREREILTLIAKGLNRPEIAQLLNICQATVATHIGAVYRKLNISSRSEATVEAIRLGLLRP